MRDSSSNSNDEKDDIVHFSKEQLRNAIANENNSTRPATADNKERNNQSAGSLGSSANSNNGLDQIQQRQQYLSSSDE